MIFRNFFIGFGGGIQLLYFKINPITGFPRNLVKDLIIRVVAGQLTFGIINFTISLISIGTALILFETNPFWVAILACLVLKERVQLIEVVGMFICFGGVLMIAFAKQKRIDESESGEVDEKDQLDSFDQWLGLAGGLIAAWTMGFNAIYNRKLKHLNHNVIMFYHGSLGCLICCIILAIEGIVNGGFRTYEDSNTYIFLLSGGFLDCICVNMLTIAYQKDSSGFVSLMAYTIVVYGFLADILIF